MNCNGVRYSLLFCLFLKDKVQRQNKIQGLLQLDIFLGSIPLRLQFNFLPIWAQFVFPMLKLDAILCIKVHGVNHFWSSNWACTHVETSCFRFQIPKSFFLLLPFARRTAQEKIRFYATLRQTLNFAPAPISEPPPPLSLVFTVSKVWPISLNS